MKKKLLASVLAASVLASVGFSTVYAMGLEEADGYPSSEQIDKILDENLNKQLDEWNKMTKEGQPNEHVDFNGKVHDGSTEDYIPGVDQKLEENVAKGADEVLDKVAEAAKPAAKMEAAKPAPAAQKVLPKTSAVK